MTVVIITKGPVREYGKRESSTHPHWEVTVIITLREVTHEPLVGGGGVALTPRAYLCSS